MRDPGYTAGSIHEGAAAEALHTAAQKALANAASFRLTPSCYIDLATLPSSLLHLAADGLQLPASPADEVLKMQLKDWNALTNWRIGE